MNDKRKSLYVNKRDHESYELTMGTKVDADGLLQDIYQLKNTEHFRECTKEQFENEFQSFD